MRKWIIPLLIALGLSFVHAMHSQAPLTTPLPAGSTYYKGRIISGIGLGIIGCTNAQVPAADGSGCLEYTPSGSGGSPIPANATFVFTGTSINDDDSHALSPAISITKWVVVDNVATVTNSGNNNLHAGEWVSMRFANLWPILEGQITSGCATGQALGINCTLFQVSSTGLTATAFEFNTVGFASGGQCVSGCGTAYSAQSYFPFVTTSSAGFPATALSNTNVFIPSTVTIAGIATNYAAFLHPLSPAVTGNPGYLIISNSNNDAATCVPAATTETAYQTIFADAHADGYTVVVTTPTGAYWSQFTLGCSTAYNLQATVGSWLRQQGKLSVLANAPTSTQFWDIISDVHHALWDGLNTNYIVASNSGLAPAGSDLMGRLTASDIFNGTGAPLAQLIENYGAGAGSGYQAVNGYIYKPFADGTYAFQWWNAARTVQVAYIDTSSNGLVFPQSSSYFHVGGTGTCTGGRPFCIVGGFNIDSSAGVYGVAGITANATPSHSNCWDTNGGIIEDCGGGGGTIPFNNVTGATNTNALVTGTGGSITPSGTGVIQATKITGTISAGTNVTITGSGTTTTPYIVNAAGGGGGGTTLGIVKVNKIGTYTSGTTYTNTTTGPVTETVTMTATGTCTGTDFRIVAIIDDWTAYGPASGITNDCAGVASITFNVGVGSTFSVTASQVSGESQSYSITGWWEDQWTGGGGSPSLFGATDPNGYATPVMIQSKFCGAGVTLTITCTYDSDVTSGDQLYFVYTSDTGNAPVSTTDTLSTSLGSYDIIFSGSSTTRIFQGVAIASGADTITVVGATGNNHPVVMIYEVTNTQGLPDGINVTGTGTSITINKTTTASNDLLFSVWYDNYGESCPTVSSGWTMQCDRPSSSYTIGVAYQVAGIATSYPITWSSSQSGNAAILGIYPMNTPISGVEGQLYFQTSASPYTEFVNHTSAWHQVQ